MFSWVKEQYGNLQDLRQQNLSELADYYKHKGISWAQGVCARSAVDTDPTTIETSRLKARFDNQPGYALFEDTPYLIDFTKDKAVVTKLNFRRSLHPSQLEKIKALFPPESVPLDKKIDANLDLITKAIEPMPPQGISLNHALLRPYFSHPSAENVPFIKFSDIWLIKIEPDNKIDEAIKHITEMEGYQNQPILIHQIKASNYLFGSTSTTHLYGNTNGNKWDTTKLDNDLITQLDVTFTHRPSLLSYNLQHAPLYQHINEKDAHTHFSENPQQVTFIQNLINALYFIKKVLLTIEQPSTTAITQGISYFFGGAVPVDAYEILKYLTEIDIDFSQHFKDEISEFSYALERFYQYSQLSSTDFSTSFSQENLITWPFQLGNITGLATRYIYDPKDQMDVHALSQFSVDLPKHIDTITTFLSANTDTVTERAPHINQDQLHELQKEATHLLNKLRSVQEHKKFSMNPIRQMLQIINYALLIRHLIILISGTVNQIGFLHEAYQELLRTYLQILNYQIFPRLMACAYKIEIELILEPGSLWRPLLQRIIGFYAFLTPYIKNLADFSKLGPELLVVEDSVFLNECQAFIQILKDESNNNQLKLQWAQTAAEAFFDSSNNDMDDLAKQYVLIEPYLKDINPEANNAIIEQFQNETRLNIPNRILVKSKLFSHLKKLSATEVLRFEQCGAVLKSTDSYSNLQLFPYRNRTGCDIALVDIKGPLNIAKLELSKIYPVLFRYKEHMRPKYMLYGNTDGKHWDFSPIDETFVGEDIQVRFKQTLNGQSPILQYHPLHEALYRHIANRKAHTHYASQFDCEESRAFAPKERTVQLAFKPFDYLNSKLPNPKALHKPDTFLEVDRRQDELDHLPMTQFDQRNAQITDLNNLSSDEALTLYAWYQHKISSFNTASEQIDTFRKTIQKYFRLSIIDFKAKPKLRHHCQQLYSKIRPYLIGMTNFPDFDQEMIALFSQDTAAQPFIINQQTIEKYFTNFSLRHAHERIRFWQDRATAILMYAESKHKDEYRLKGLITHSPKEARTDLLLKDAHLSANIQKFRTALQKWIPSLQPRIQAQLQPSENDLPFPEIQDNPQEQLRQIPTVLLFKRIFNAAYHLHQIAIYIEKLHRARNNKLKTANTKLATDLWNKHGAYLRDLGPQLYADPILASIGQNAKRQYQTILGQIVTLFQPYTTNAMTVEPTDQSVQNNGLWYTVNAVYLIPDHLIYLTERPESMSEERRKLIPEEQQRLHRIHLQKLQIAAKQTASHIERIIRDSGSNFKLFLACKVIYGLNIEIRQKLEHFAKEMQGVALSHLELLYRDYFTPMLQEGELWEARLGTLPGKITQPLKIIIDAWYQGWLFSLDIPFDAKEKLACDHTVSYDQRILAETARLHEAQEKLKHAQDIWDADAQNKLTSKQREKALASNPALSDLALGRQAEHAFTIQSAEEKLQYLRTEKLNYALEAQRNYRNSFAEHYIKTYISSLSYYAHGMKTRDVHQEYTRELKTFIENQKNKLLADIEPKEYISRETEEDEIIEDIPHIQPPDNVEKYLSEQLKETNEQFQAKHFAAYHRLDQIQQAIESFQTHLKRDKTISAELRDRKLQCLEALSAVLQTDHHHPDRPSLDCRLAQRLNRIKENIEQSETEAILLEHHPRYANCFAWLVDCLIQLMTAIGLYTPTRQKHYNALLKATKPIAPPSFLNLWSTPSTPLRVISANDRRIVTPGYR